MTAHSTTPSDEMGKSGDTLDLTAFFRLVGDAESAPPDQAALAHGSRPLPWWRRLWEVSTVRKAMLLLLLATAWHLYARHLNNPLALPDVLATARAFWQEFRSGELPLRILMSLKILFAGYFIGVACAALLSIAAMTSRLAGDLLETLTTMLNPLPAIALLPLALLWFGIGTFSIIFVIVHAVLWPITLNVLAGFASISPTLKLVGRNYGLSGPRFAARILIPAAFPSVVAGLKNGWAFAWRTLIAAELVFGVSSGSGGLGWFIYEKKNQLETDAVFAGFCTVIIIGILFERCVFYPLERRTLHRWGMRA